MFIQPKNITSVDFKEGWTDLELLGVKAMVNLKVYNPFQLDTTVNSYHMFYTSSSSCAMLNVQGDELSLDDGQTYVSYFALTDNHVVIAVCYDKDENTVYYRLD